MGDQLALQRARIACDMAERALLVNMARADVCHSRVDIFKQLNDSVCGLRQVVYECVICDIDGNPKDCWVQLFEKHTTRFTIGSDQVGKFSGSLRLAQKVHKYNKLLALLSDEAAENLGHKNAERIYFHRLKKLQQNESLPNALAHSFY